MLPPASRIVKEIGDGLLLWFDDPVDALCTALTVQEHLAESARRRAPLWVRIGVHWGAPKRRGDDLIGHDVNLASRVTGLAGPGEVLCTGAVVDALGGAAAVAGVRIEFVGATYVKGWRRPCPCTP
ncbi:MAG: adenylate/guanylate cyclase domain-containing protein [Ilumatobacteraceae bacterium]